MFLTLGKIRRLIHEMLDHNVEAWIYTPNDELVPMPGMAQHTYSVGGLCGVKRPRPGEGTAQDYEIYENECDAAYNRWHNEGMITIRTWSGGKWSATMNVIDQRNLQRLKNVLERIAISNDTARIRIVICDDPLSNSHVETLNMYVNDVFLARNVRELREFNQS